MLNVLAYAPANTGGNGHHHSSPIFLVIFGVVFAAIGLLNALRPDLSFKMNRWQYKNKQAWEPSRTALVVGRISGCIAIVVGIVFIAIGATR